MARPPLYLSVAEMIRQRIEAGEWKPGDQLPNERDLAKQFFVSRVTLREALGLLEHEGIVVRRHGRGSFVVPKPMHIAADLARLEPFTQVGRQAGLVTREEILSLEMVPIPPRQADALGRTPGSPCYKLEMLRWLENIPVIYSHDYVLPDVMDPDEFRTLGRNILDYLSETGRTGADYAYLRVRAVLPDPYGQKVLQCGPFEPLVRLDGTAYSADQRPLYATTFLIRSKHYDLTVLRKAGDGGGVNP